MQEVVDEIVAVEWLPFRYEGGEQPSIAKEVSTATNKPENDPPEQRDSNVCQCAVSEEEGGHEIGE